MTKQLTYTEQFDEARRSRRADKCDVCGTSDEELLIRKQMPVIQILLKSGVVVVVDLHVRTWKADEPAKLAGGVCDDCQEEILEKLGGDAEELDLMVSEPSPLVYLGPDPKLARREGFHLVK